MHFQLTMGVLGHTPIVNQGACVHCRVSVEECFKLNHRKSETMCIHKWKMLNVGEKSSNIFSVSKLVIFRWRMEYKFCLPFLKNKLVCKEYITYKKFN